MKKRDVQPGLRVEITGIPYQGRTGVVRNRMRLPFMTAWDIWCDDPDMFGRRLARMRASKFRPLQIN